MALFEGAKEVVRVLREFLQVLPMLGYKMPEPDVKDSLGATFEATVEAYPDNTMLLFEGREWTYAGFNREANQLAHLLTERGLGRGDTVALLMENRAEFVLAMLAMAKLGVAASLINNSLTGKALVHCVKATGAKAFIVGEERVSVLDEVRGELGITANFWFADSGKAVVPAWAEDAGAAMKSQPDTNIPLTREITAGEVAMYIFTSGTTGLPKAAIVKHRRLLAASKGIGRVGFQPGPEDRLYLCLPIYHITGLGPGLCAFLATGGSVFLRRSFSASRFWPEVQQYQTNCFAYVGELCRYLSAQPPCPEERDNPLQKMLGNGLRPDIWETFKTRFDVPRIFEIYGSSEGNVTFLNLFNKEKTIGASVTKVALLSYDIEADEIVRDASGLCVEVAPGEPGLLVAEITHGREFDGYTNAEASEQKILQNVQRQGDRWFNTGDLIRRVDVGFALGFKHYQFVDRTGDTFRWRAENVSTNEVAEVLNLHPQITMANVYGVEVPGVEGRAGMVAFAVEGDEAFDWDGFQQLVERELPVYAQPVFVRLLHSTETTVTFKLVKGELREQAFHPDRVDGDTVFVRLPRSEAYRSLDGDAYHDIMRGEAGF